jgi:hypothetical protein
LSCAAQLICRLQVDNAPLSYPGSSKVFLRAVAHRRNDETRPVMQTQARDLPADFNSHGPIVLFWEAMGSHASKILIKMIS